MSYTDDAVKAKLAALNETQEGIVQVAQWVMFHRRQAGKTAELWLQRLKDSNSTKRLNLIYLANEVIQQSKARKKTEFVSAFSPILPDAATVAYRGATTDVQNKIRRVVEVWRQRQIFETSVQESIERGIDDVDRSRSGAPKRGALGGSLFQSNKTSNDLPTELAPLLPLQTQISKATVSAPGLINAAESTYDTQVANPSEAAPSPPLQAARLSNLLKQLASAEGAVAEGIRARTSMVTALEKLLADNRAAIEKEEETRAGLSAKMADVEERKKTVEDGIMRGLSDGGSAPPPTNNLAEPARPAVERLTPPPPTYETLTPVGSPRPNAQGDSNGASATPQEPEPAPSAPQPGADLLSSLTMHHGGSRRRSSGEGMSAPAGKKPRLGSGQIDDASAVFGSGNAMDELDDDVAAMLGDKN